MVQSSKRPRNSIDESSLIHHASSFLSNPQKPPRESIEFLVNHLESNCTNSTLTHDDIASLLLPWSIKKLLHSPSELEWKTLSVCLSTRSKGPTPSESFRLIPLAANADSHHAAACHSALARLSRPTLSQASHWLPIHPHRVSIARDAIQAMIEATSRSNVDKAWEVLDATALTRVGRAMKHDELRGEIAVLIRGLLKGWKWGKGERLFEDIRGAMGDSIDVVWLIPEIVRGYFECSRDVEWTVRFKFWWRIVLPGVERLDHRKDGNEKLELVEMVSETLDFVMEYDVYSPSYADENGENVGFLEVVMKAILVQCDGGHDDSNLSNDERRTMYLLSSIRTLLLLNHRLVHGLLSKPIAFACSSRYRFPKGKSYSNASSLLSTIVRTYGELRQIGYFLSSAREVFVHDDGTKGNQPFHSMDRFLICRRVKDSLAFAYQSCPSGQIHEVWEFFDGWVKDTADRSSTMQTSNDEIEWTVRRRAELTFAVSMFLLFIKSVRMDKHNATELRDLSETSMTSSLAKLLIPSVATLDFSNDCSKDRSEDDTILGIELCAWLLDLHTRSCFWIDSMNVDEHGPTFFLPEFGHDGTRSVFSYLYNIASETVGSEDFRSWREKWHQSVFFPEKSGDLTMPLSLCSSLQRLSLHRIHQLHSMIYYRTIQEDDLGVDEASRRKLSSSDLIDEAKMLVNFSIYIASSHATKLTVDDVSDMEEPELLWSSVVQSLGIWSHYSEGFHINIFLQWFFCTLSHGDERLGAHDTGMMLTLVRDASFYDVKEISSRLVPAGLEFVIHWVLNELEQSTDDSTTALRKCVESESTEVAKSFLELVPHLQMKSAFQKGNSCMMKGTVTVLSFLASVPLTITLSQDKMDLVDRVLGLDVLICRLYDIHTTALWSDTCDDLFLRMLCALRNILANLMSRCLMTSSERDSELLVMLTDHVVRSCFKLGANADVLNASGSIVCEVFSVCLDYHDKDVSLLERFCKRLNDLIVMYDPNESPTEFTARLALIRSVVRRMNILEHHHSLSKNYVPSSESYQLFKNFVVSIADHLWIQIIDTLAVPESESGRCREGAVSLLLAVEIVSFLGNHIMMIGESDPSMNGLVDPTKEKVKCIFQLVANKTFSQNSDLVAATHYFLASVSAVPILCFTFLVPTMVIETLVDEMKRTFSEGVLVPLLDAALCSLIRHSELEHIEFVVGYLSIRDEDPNTALDAFRVKIYHLLISCVKQQDQIQFLSGHALRFLLESTSLFRHARSGPPDISVSEIELFAKMVVTLISKKELLLLSEREIALICCEMSPLFHIHRTRADRNEEVVIFKSCCSVVSSLVAHYPKRLYSCPSPFFSLLLSLLTYVLQTDIKGGLHKIALEYAKICELLIPHKDVFKKHVVGLLLQFIHALNRGMHPNTKSRLMPSIYALLDMCNEFEVKHINAMIDVSSKALFAPVFQSYQKYYQYHGQA